MDVSNHSSDKDLDFIPICIPKHQLDHDEKVPTFIFVNKFCSKKMNPLLNKVRKIFNILESIRLNPKFHVCNPIPSRLTLSIDHLFIGLRLPFLPIV